MVTPHDRTWIIDFCPTLFGPASYPTYSVATAHANDHTATEHMVELSASLLFYFSIGSVISPVLLALLVNHHGPASMLVGREKRRSTPYVYMPRTSCFIGHLLRFKRHPRDD